MNHPMGSSGGAPHLDLSAVASGLPQASLFTNTGLAAARNTSASFGNPTNVGVNLAANTASAFVYAAAVAAAQQQQQQQWPAPINSSVPHMSGINMAPLGGMTSADHQDQFKTTTNNLLQNQQDLLRGINMQSMQSQQLNLMQQQLGIQTVQQQLSHQNQAQVLNNMLLSPTHGIQSMNFETTPGVRRGGGVQSSNAVAQAEAMVQSMLNGCRQPMSTVSTSHTDHSSTHSGSGFFTSPTRGSNYSTNSSSTPSHHHSNSAVHGSTLSNYSLNSLLGPSTSSNSATRSSSYAPAQPQFNTVSLASILDDTFATTSIHHSCSSASNDLLASTSHQYQSSSHTSGDLFSPNLSGSMDLFDKDTPYDFGQSDFNLLDDDKLLLGPDAYLSSVQMDQVPGSQLFLSALECMPPPPSGTEISPGSNTSNGGAQLGNNSTIVPTLGTNSAPRPPSHHQQDLTGIMSSTNNASSGLQMHSQNDFNEIDRNLQRHLSMVVAADSHGNTLQGFGHDAGLLQGASNNFASTSYAPYGVSNSTANFSSTNLDQLNVGTAARAQASNYSASGSQSEEKAGLSPARFSPVRFSPIPGVSSPEDQSEKLNFPADTSTKVYIPSPEQSSDIFAIGAARNNSSSNRKTKRVPIYKQVKHLLDTPAKHTRPVPIPTGSTSMMRPESFTATRMPSYRKESKITSDDSPYCFTDEEEDSIRPVGSESTGKKDAPSAEDMLREKKLQEEVNKKLLEISSLHPELKVANMISGPPGGSSTTAATFPMPAESTFRASSTCSSSTSYMSPRSNATASEKADSRKKPQPCAVTASGVTSSALQFPGGPALDTGPTRNFGTNLSGLKVSDLRKALARDKKPLVGQEFVRTRVITDDDEITTLTLTRPHETPKPFLVPKIEPVIINNSDLNRPRHDDVDLSQSVIDSVVSAVSEARRAGNSNDAGSTKHDSRLSPRCTKDVVIKTEPPDHEEPMLSIEQTLETCELQQIQEKSPRPSSHSDDFEDTPNIFERLAMDRVKTEEDSVEDKETAPRPLILKISMKGLCFSTPVDGEASPSSGHHHKRRHKKKKKKHKKEKRSCRDEAEGDDGSKKKKRKRKHRDRPCGSDVGEDLDIDANIRQMLRCGSPSSVLEEDTSSGRRGRQRRAKSAKTTTEGSTVAEDEDSGSEFSGFEVDDQDDDADPCWVPKLQAAGQQRSDSVSGGSGSVHYTQKRHGKKARLLGDSTDFSAIAVKLEVSSVPVTISASKAESSSNMEQTLEDVCQSVAKASPSNRDNFALSPQPVMKPASSRVTTFQKGSFVVLKEDVGKGSDCPIWRVDNQNLLQKFHVLSEANDTTVYQSTPTYSGWAQELADRYLLVSVKILEQSRNSCVVQLFSQLSELVPAVSTEISDSYSCETLYGGLSPPECDQHGAAPRGTPLPDQPLRDSFDMYLHALILHALTNGNYLLRLSQDWKVAKPFNDIEAMNAEKKAHLLNRCSWQDSFKEMLQWYPFFTLSDPEELCGVTCQACGSRAAEASVQIYGDPYFMDSLQSREHRTTGSGSPIPSQEFHVCRFCAEVATSYHKLHHMKYNLYRKCEDKVEIILDEVGSNVEAAVVTEQCLRNRPWVNSLVQEYLDFWQSII